MADRALDICIAQGELLLAELDRLRLASRAMDQPQVLLVASSSNETNITVW